MQTRDLYTVSERKLTWPVTIFGHTANDCKFMCMGIPSMAPRDYIEFKPRNSKEMFSSLDKYFAALI